MRWLAHSGLPSCNQPTLRLGTAHVSAMCRSSSEAVSSTDTGEPRYRSCRMNKFVGGDTKKWRVWHAASSPTRLVSRQHAARCSSRWSLKFVPASSSLLYHLRYRATPTTSVALPLLREDQQQHEGISQETLWMHYYSGPPHFLFGYGFSVLSWGIGSQEPLNNVPLKSYRNFDPNPYALPTRLGGGQHSNTPRDRLSPIWPKVFI